MLSQKLSLPKLKANINLFATNPNDKKLIQANLQSNPNAELKRLEGVLTSLIKTKVQKGPVGWANNYDRGIAVLVQKSTGLQVAGFDGVIITSPSMISFQSTVFPLKDSIKFILNQEGTKVNMYSDTAGRVTVGTGHMIPNKTAVINLHSSILPFYQNQTSIKASDKEVEDQFVAIQNKTSLQNTIYPLEVKSSDIDNLFSVDVNKYHSDLLSMNAFTNFDSLPNSIKIIALDFSFNLNAKDFVGNGDPKRAFPKMIAAINKRDWLTAKGESSRVANQVKLTRRNDAIDKLFDEAIIVEDPYFVTEASEHLMLKSDGSLIPIARKP